MSMSVVGPGNRIIHCWAGLCSLIQGCKEEIAMTAGRNVRKF
jgi:hypothetical protein